MKYIFLISIMIFAYSSSSFAFEKGDKVELKKDYEVTSIKGSKRTKDLDKGTKLTIQSCTKNECVAKYWFYVFKIKKSSIKKVEKRTRGNKRSDATVKTNKKKSSGGFFDIFKKKDKKSAKKKRTSGKITYGAPVCGCSGCSFGSKFGPRKPPTAGASSFHAARDIRAPKGTPVTAIAAGTLSVRSQSKTEGYGNQLRVVHSSTYESRYAHLDSFVRTSGYVEKGDLIGFVGSTGISTGPHLHLEVLRNGKKVNPDSYVGSSNSSLKGQCKASGNKKKTSKSKRKSKPVGRRARGVQ